CWVCQSASVPTIGPPLPAGLLAPCQGPQLSRGTLAPIGFALTMLRLARRKSTSSAGEAGPVAHSSSSSSQTDPSQRHLAADFGRIEGGAIAGIFHRATVHDREIIAELAGKVEILFDQHDGDIGKIAQVGDGAGNILDDRGLNAFGRLVEQK